MIDTESPRDLVTESSGKEKVTSLDDHLLRSSHEDPVDPRSIHRPGPRDTSGNGMGPEGPCRRP